MGRLPRLCLPGVPQHVIQRGNNRQACFGADEDSSAYAFWLEEYCREFGVSVHAWVFMTNHVHLLLTPSDKHGVSATGLGQQAKLWTPHEIYLGLGKTPGERAEAYRALFVGHIDDQTLVQIRTAANQGMALGNDRFKEEIERLACRRARAMKKG